MDYNRWRQPFWGRKLILELLEERIVMDASIDNLFHNAQGADHSHGDVTVHGDTAASNLDHSLLPQPAKHGLDVIVISNDLAPSNIDLLEHAAPANAKIIVYDAAHENLKSLTSSIAHLAEENGAKIEHLAVVAHADKGLLLIGSEQINVDNFADHKAELEELSRYLTDTSQVQLYGCSIAADEAGKTLTQEIGQALHAAVFASEHRTGAHGDWNLEYATVPGQTPGLALDSGELKNFQGDLLVQFVTPGITVPTVTVNTSVPEVYLGETVAVDQTLTNPSTITLTVTANPDLVNDTAAAGNRVGVANLSLVDIISTATGYTFTQISTTSFEVAGTLDQVNQVLHTLTARLSSFYVANTPSTPGQIELVATDPTDSTVASIIINIAFAPDPNVTAPTTQTVTANTATTIPMSVTDANQSSLTMSFSTAHGSVALPSTPGVVQYATTSNDDGFRTTYKFFGSVNAINTALAGVTYTGFSGYTGLDDLKIVANDGPTQTVKHVAVTVA